MAEKKEKSFLSKYGFIFIIIPLAIAIAWFYLYVLSPKGIN